MLDVALLVAGVTDLDLRDLDLHPGPVTSWIWTNMKCSLH